MGRPAGSFTVALGGDLKSRVVAAARAGGTTPSVLVRRAVAEALSQVAGGGETPVPATRTEEPLTEIRVRVPESVAVRIAAASRAAGLTRGAFVSAAIAELADRTGKGSGAVPPHGVEAAGFLRDALVRSNATLAPIGRNLNQIARALNMHPALASVADRQSLAEVARRVCEHLELASELLHAIRVPKRPAARANASSTPGKLG